MASYIGASLCFFFIFSLSFSLQIQARDSKLFNKFSRQQTTKNTKLLDTTPATAPSSEPVVVDRGYGLYGGENYRYPPMTVDPVKMGFGVGKEKRFVSMEELRNEPNGNGNEKQGMSDTRFLENGKYYYDIGQDIENENGNGNGNGYETEKQGVSEHVENGNRYPENRENGNGYGYGTEKQGMSDTRFLENGRYYYDVNRDVKDENRYEGDNKYVTEKQGMSRENVVDEPENQEEGNGNEYVTEKQGMSDTRFFENGKHSYDANRDVKDENTYKRNGKGYVTEKHGMSTHVVDENVVYPENQGNGNNNGYVTEKEGMSDTRFLENGRYYYDVSNEVKDENSYPQNTRHYNGNGNGNKSVFEKQGKSDTKFLENGNGHSTENNENEYFETQENNYKFDNSYESKDNFLNRNNGYGTGYYNENEQYGGNGNNNNNGYMTHERRDNNYNPNEYMTQGSSRDEYNGPPNQYDTMEEYEKEEEYRLSKQYGP